MKRLLASIAFLVPCLALAAGWGLTRSYGTFGTEAACKAAAASQPAGSYICTNVLQTPVTVPTVGTGTWKKIAAEYGAFTLSATSTVRFGAGTTWTQKTFPAGSYTCQRSTFDGIDPLAGTAKECDLLDGAPVVVGSATISWLAPTKNADGTPLTDLAGYRVAYGPTSGTYSQTIDVAASPVTVSNLSIGKWFFVVRAIDTSGNQSVASAEVSKAIQ